MRKLFSWIGALAILLAIGHFAWPERMHGLCEKAGLCEQRDLMGAMLVSVQRQQKLLVLTARLVAPITSVRDTTLGPITMATTKQTAILPATVTYVVDLAAMEAADLRWDEATQKLTVKRPPVEPQEPAIQWEKAKIYEDNTLVSALTSVNENLQQDNREKAPVEFQRQSRSADLLKLADAAADDALAATFRMALVASGYSSAEVAVTR